MKFLCVPCDTPMKLQTLGPPERGSLSVVYSCPECGYEMAMLTNPYETQIVQSLGVRIGPDRLRAEAAAAGQETGSGTAIAGSSSAAEPGRCPFPSMISAMDGTQPFDSAHGVPGEALRPSSGQAGEPVPVRWTPAAEARLANIPEFVRPMARTGIERFARERGAVEIDEKVLDAAREFFGM